MLVVYIDAEATGFEPGSGNTPRAMQKGKRMMGRTKNIDVALVYELWGEYADAANAGDLERWISLWSDDGIQIAPGTPLRIGKEQIREAMRATFDLFDRRDMTIHTEEGRVLGDWAYSYGTFTFEVTPKDGAKTSDYCGKFLDILMKGADGSWKIAIDCHNYDGHRDKTIAVGRDVPGERR